MQIINDELVLKDLEYTEKRLEDLEKQVKRSNPKEAKEEIEILTKVKEYLVKGIWVRKG